MLLHVAAVWLYVILVAVVIVVILVVVVIVVIVVIVYVGAVAVAVSVLIIMVAAVVVVVVVVVTNYYISYYFSAHGSQTDFRNEQIVPRRFGRKSGHANRYRLFNIRENSKRLKQIKISTV